jgi:hypothetical protein
LFFCFFSACANKQIVAVPSSGLALTSSDNGSLLFPDGRYQQEVRVDVTAMKMKQSFDFDCLIQKSKDDMFLYGYNNFGISLFKIREKNGEPLQAEASVESIRKHQDFFVRIFHLVQKIMTLQRQDPRLVHNHIDLEADGIQSHVQFEDADKQGVPTHFIVEEKDQYRVDVKTTSFTLLTTGKDHHSH